MPSKAHCQAVSELIQQLDSSFVAANGNDYNNTAIKSGLQYTFTNLENHLQGISALADLLLAHDTTRGNGHPSLNAHCVGGLHAALCALSHTAVNLMDDVHQSLTTEKAP